MVLGLRITCSHESYKTKYMLVFKHIQNAFFLEEGVAKERNYNNVVAICLILHFVLAACALQLSLDGMQQVY